MTKPKTTLDDLIARFIQERDRLAANQPQTFTADAIRQLTPAMAVHYIPEGNPAWIAAKVCELFRSGDVSGAMMFKLTFGGAA